MNWPAIAFRRDTLDLMRDNRHGQRTPEPLPSQAGATTTSSLQDKSSEKLTKMAKNLGNDEIKKRIDSGNAHRDELLKHLVERLQVIRDVQLREVAMCDKDANFEWWRTVGDSQKDVDKPDPTRWKECARAYEGAAFHLCRGDLTRGMAEMQRAMDVERRAFDTLTKLVEVSEKEREVAGPEALQAAPLGSTAGACAEPEGVKLAADIQNVTTTVKDTPVRERVLDPWWTLEEEEEEEKPDGNGA